MAQPPIKAKNNLLRREVPIKTIKLNPTKLLSNVNKSPFK